MSSENRHRIRCPECNADLVVDATTGEILYHEKAAAEPAGGRTLESLMQGLDDDKTRREDVFERERAALEDRDRLLDEKFKEAMSRAEETEDVTPPLRPFDLD